MLASKLRLEQIASQIAGNRVLMRVDFNVPMKNGVVTDLNRIVSSLPSINFVRDSKARSLVLMSHLGRPDGKVNPKYSLKPLIPELNKLLNTDVQFVPSCVGPEAEQICRFPKPGSVYLLENLRFHLEEEVSIKNPDGTKEKAQPEKVQSFRDSLSSLGDLYVNDAFGTSHRAHSSIVGINLKTRAAGFLMAKELSYFSKVVENPKRPLLVILGGAKVKDKIPLIRNLLNICNEMIIGGGMCFTFKKVLENYYIGRSLFDSDSASLIREIMDLATLKDVKIHFPVDFVCSDSVDSPQSKGASREIPHGLMGLDIGPESVKLFSEVISRASTVVWNGPVGAFENKNYSKGSEGILQSIAGKTDGISIVGGGDTAAFVFGEGEISEKISHISTGGGASLELLEGKILPGISSLSDS